jgi:tripartite-type tricarboxylate transporter receptor subunit TctC
MTKAPLLAGAALSALLAVPLCAHAQAGFPNRPVKIVVPVVPGSFTDLAAFTRRIATETQIWRDLVARRGIKVQ